MTRETKGEYYEYEISRPGDINIPGLWVACECRVDYDACRSVLVLSLIGLHGLRVSLRIGSQVFKQRKMIGRFVSSSGADWSPCIRDLNADWSLRVACDHGWLNKINKIDTDIRKKVVWSPRTSRRTPRIKELFDIPARRATLDDFIFRRGRFLWNTVMETDIGFHEDRASYVWW